MSQRRPELVVGVGASAGGLEAFKQLLQALPDDSGMTFLLVQHLDPSHDSMLQELLAPHTGMTLAQAEHDLELEADHVYIIRPDTALAVRDGRIEISTPALQHGVRYPVDHLFRSLAHEYGPRAVGIILSGSGSDGSDGLREIKMLGGLTIVQEPSESRQRGMPQSAIDAVHPGLVIPIDEMPAVLLRFGTMPEAGHPPTVEDAHERADSLQTLSRDELNRLAAVLATQADFDLRVYKAGTTERRAIRRMALTGFDSFDGYLEHIRADAEEQRALVRDLLISVTNFFRDPEVFAVLRKEVIDPLVAEGDVDPIRVWVAGCATGEEAYSLGIEFLEAIESGNHSTGLQIFATDIDERALGVAREGVYSSSIDERISPERLERFFQPLKGRGYQVRKRLRETISFAIHDLTKHPPFSRMQLVSCRSVLIYLRPAAQREVLKSVHFALEPGGHLLFGASESTSAQRDLFQAVSRPACLYRRVGKTRVYPFGHSSMSRRIGAGNNPTATRGREEPGPRAANDEHDLARRAVLTALVPPTLIVADHGRVVFTHGDLRPFLRLPEGDDPQLVLSEMIIPSLSTRVRSALYTCRRDGERVEAVAKTEDGRPVTITASRATGFDDGAVVLSFTPAADDVSSQQPLGSESINEELEKELMMTREDLRNTVEELETSNEELRSSHEESMSMNEELQSANEELEASTEELRALNEELTTMNQQLREKISQLEQAHDDLHNFFASTKVATVFLDEQLRIKRFTPAASELLDIHHGDIDRSASSIAHELLQESLEAEARDVLDRLAAPSREIRTSDDRWYVRELLPYRTEARRIEGVIVTFRDETSAKRAAERLLQRESQQSVIAAAGLQALQDVDPQRFMERVVREIRATLDADFVTLLELLPGARKLWVRAGSGWPEDIVGEAVVDADVESQAGYTLESQTPVVVHDLAGEGRFSGPPLLTDHGVRSGVSCVIGETDRPYGVLGVYSRAVRDFTDEDVHFIQAMASVIESALARHRTRMSQAMELDIAATLADAIDLDAALPLLTTKLMNRLGASIGEVWWKTDDDLLRCRFRSSSIGLREADFDADVLSVDSDGLVGHAFATGNTVRYSGLDPSIEFTRHDAAERLGLHSGLALPIKSGVDVLGVIAYFSSAQVIADEELLHSLESVGRTIGDFVTWTDIEKGSRRLAAICESSHDAIFAYDFDGVITDWLPGAERQLGFSEAAMLGESIERIIPTELRDHFWHVTHRIRRGEQVDVFTTQRCCANGELLDVSVRCSAVRAADGAIVAVSSTDRDITPLRTVEHQLIEADRQKNEFISMLSHELRNPLAALRTSTELLRTEDDDVESRRNSIKVLERQCAHVADLLDGLLDVSRIIHGRIRIRRETTDLTSICRDTLTDLHRRTEDRDLEITDEIPAHAVSVRGDATRLTQIVDNLLTNAVKYTPDGGSIHLALSRHDGEAVLVVRDTGVGINAALLPHVFDTFRQAGQNLDRSEGGLGLGLSLVKSLVELHDGTVEAHSRGAGHGAEFVVQFPLVEDAEVRQGDTTSLAPPVSALKILVIEDHVDSATALATLLRRFGHEVRVAGTGADGIATVEAWNPDVVLCDVGLPDMTGYEIAGALRASTATRDTHLVAVTGYGRPEDKQRCLDAGFDMHLTKPVDVTVLKQMFRPERDA